MTLTISKTMDGIQIVPTFPGRIAHSSESLNQHMASSGNGKHEENTQVVNEHATTDVEDARRLLLHLNLISTLDGIQIVPTFPGRIAHSSESLNQHMASSGNGKHEENPQAANGADMEYDYSFAQSTPQPHLFKNDGWYSIRAYISWSLRPLSGVSKPTHGEIRQWKVRREC